MFGNLDYGWTFHSGSLDGTKSTLQGGSVVTQFPVIRFSSLFINSADVYFIWFAMNTSLFFKVQICHPASC